MPITTEFEYVKPKDLNETLHLLALYKETAKVLAGGTDLHVKIRLGLKSPRVLFDISELAPGRSIGLFVTHGVRWVPQWE